MLRNLLIALTLLCTPAWATWGFVNHATNTACSSGTSCAITVPSTGSGNFMFISLFMSTSTNVTISSISGAGTWAACPASACHAFSSPFNIDGFYNLSTTSGVTAITVTLSGTSGGTFRLEATELSYTSGPVNFDSAGTVVNSGACGVTPSFQCAMVPLTLTGTNDALFQYCIGNPNCNAIGGGYTADIFNGDLLAYKLNSQAAPAPYLTASSGSSLLTFGGASFTEAANPNNGLLGGKMVNGGKVVIGGR